MRGVWAVRRDTGSRSSREGTYHDARPLIDTRRERLHVRGLTISRARRISTYSDVMAQTSNTRAWDAAANAFPSSDDRTWKRRTTSLSYLSWILVGGATCL